MIAGFYTCGRVPQRYRRNGRGNSLREPFLINIKPILGVQARKALLNWYHCFTKSVAPVLEGKQSREHRPHGMGRG